MSVHEFVHSKLMGAETKNAPNMYRSDFRVTRVYGLYFVCLSVCGKCVVYNLMDLYAKYVVKENQQGQQNLARTRQCCSSTYHNPLTSTTLSHYHHHHRKKYLTSKVCCTPAFEYDKLQCYTHCHFNLLYIIIHYLLYMQINSTSEIFCHHLMKSLPYFELWHCDSCVRVCVCVQSTLSTYALMLTLLLE